MYSLTGKPEQSVNIGGIEYPLNLTFKNVIKAYDIMDSDISDEDKINQVFELVLTPDITRSVQVRSHVVEAVFSYVNIKPYGNQLNADSDEYTQKQDVYTADFDFEQDGAAIYASFVYDYGIDLTQQTDMHWDVFKALFDNLSPDSPIQRIRAIRGEDPTKYGDDSDKVDRINEQQAYYSLDKAANSVDAESNENAVGSIFGGMIAQAKIRGKEE